MVEAALFIIGPANISDAEVRIAARYVGRTVAESQEMAHLGATYLLALGETHDAQPTESAIAVFPSVEAKIAFDEKLGASENVSYTRVDFDGLPVIEAQGQWEQRDAVDALTAVLEDVRKMVDGFGLLNAVARQFYVAPNTLFVDGPIKAARSLLDRIEAHALDTQKAAAEAGVQAQAQAEAPTGAEPEADAGTEAGAE